MKAYIDTAENLVQIIVDLIPDNQSILNMDNPWDLFKIEKFKEKQRN